jgi:hypothetical protein
MDLLNKPHLLYYIWDMPKGLKPYPVESEVINCVERLHRSGKYRGLQDLASADELFQRFWDNLIADYNGGLRIEAIQVKNRRDAKTKMIDIAKINGFIKFCNPERYETL